MDTRKHLLGAALAAGIAAIASPVMAQDTPPDTIEDADASGNMFDRLVERYSTLLGSPDSAAAMITALREGSDFTVTTTTTVDDPDDADGDGERSEEHTSELQSLMRISYAVFCLQKKKHKNDYNK